LGILQQPKGGNKENLWRFDSGSDYSSFRTVLKSNRFWYDYYAPTGLQGKHF